MYKVILVLYIWIAIVVNLNLENILLLLCDILNRIKDYFLDICI